MAIDTTIIKSYKQTEIGVIPGDWDVCDLSEAVDFLDGQRRPVKSTDRAKVSGMYPYYGASGIVDYVNDYIFDDNLILLGEDGENILSRNLPLAFQVKGKIWVNNHAHVLKPKDVFDIGYLTEYLESLDYSLFNSGTAQPKLNKHVCLKIKIAKPTKSEQEAIATVLSDTDALIECLEKLIAKKKAIKHGTMQHLLTGKKRLPGFSEEWATKRMGEIFDFSGGYTASREQLSQSGFCYLHYGDIHGAKKTYIDVKKDFLEIPKLQVQLGKISKKSILNDGDVVFVDASEDDEGASRHIVIKNQHEIPFISGLHTIVAKSKDDSLDNDFKRFCFQSANIKSQFKFYAVGTKVSGISKGNITKIELLFPTKSEQTAIATILSDMDAEIESLEQKRDKYTILKQGMMQQLLTGRIRIDANN